MAFARHGVGIRAHARAVTSQVHPVFMLPPIAASWFGAIIALEFSLLTAFIHSLAIFAAVYTAHVKDGFVDFHLREEDEDHPLTERGCWWCLYGSTFVFVSCLIALWIAVDVWAVLLTAPGWLIGYFHAPQLDMNPLGATLGYPVGISLALLGGYYVQAQHLGILVFSLALVFLILLSGIKIIDDEQDYDYDKSIGKATVAVILGRGTARQLAMLLMMGALALVAILVATRVLPVGSIGAVLVFAVVALIARQADANIATALLVRGSYVFLGLLIIAVWFRPFQS